ncbi:MAG: glutamate-5-semialdehyde dehydrogenase [Eubacteriales bacterium]
MRSTNEILRQAKAVCPALAAADTAAKNRALRGMAEALLADGERILAANRLDVAQAAQTLSPAMIDRLTLTGPRIAAMAEGIRQVEALPDPVGAVLARTERPNGLLIEKKAVPMGVIAIIYESRPNVTSDAAALALKAGSACVLRGGKEAFRSNAAIVGALQAGLRQAGLDPYLVQLVEDTSRQSSLELMTAVGLVDLLIPRGGAGLIAACMEQAKVPCIQTGTGICHLYVDRDADPAMAARILLNAKTSRPSVCNAVEVCLVHEAVAPAFLPLAYEALVTQRTAQRLPSVEFRLDERARGYITGTPAGTADFDTEFLDNILAVAVVDSPEQAIGHIARHSTGHSDAIVTDNRETAERFCAMVDSAAVYVNASTRFTDGGEFGLGCEMGISTQKLHARGPMGLAELTTYKYVIHGNGQIR